MTLIRRFVFPLILILFCSVTLVPQERRANPPSTAAKEIWAEIRMAGKPAGSYHEKSRWGVNDDVVTEIDSDIVLNRLGSKVEIKSTSHYDESAGGDLLSVTSDMSSSAQVTHMEMTVKNGVLLIRTSTGSKTYERTVPFTGTLFGPDGLRRLSLSRLKSPGDSTIAQTFYPELASIVAATNTLIGPDQLTVANQAWPSLKIEQTVSAMPGKTTVWLDKSGWMLREIQPSPFGEIEVVRTGAEKRPALTVASTPLPDEVFSRTIVRSNIRLPEERLIERLKIRITHHKPELGWPNLEADNQKVLEKTPNYVVLEINRPMPKQAVKRPVQSTRVLAPFLAPNALLQSDDAAVQATAANVTGNNTDLFSSARALQKWTNENMHFDLGIAVVPASEVARNRRGTCFGYAVLLASMARAIGIPSRIRMGFVYAGGIWGGHAWVDVLVGHDWIPLDGALYSPGPADAARFSFFASSLEEGTLIQIGSLARLFGNVDIQILEYDMHGKQVIVPESAKPFAVDGDTYRDPWLGLTITKPSSFRFANLDAAWPDKTIIAMDGPQHQRVEIESLSDSLPTSASPNLEKYLSDSGISGSRSGKNIAGYHAVVVSSPEEAGLVIVDGGNVWLIKATGPHASELLMQVASTMKTSVLLNIASVTVPR